MFIADANRHIRRVLDDIIMTNLSLSTAALKTKNKHTHTQKKYSTLVHNNNDLFFIWC